MNSEEQAEVTAMKMMARTRTTPLLPRRNWAVATGRSPEKAKVEAVEQRRVGGCVSYMTLTFLSGVI